jgi:3'(2'), 5'-bisphosphate nucleotidase
MDQLLNTAIEAAIKAGQAILEVYHSGDFDIDIKSDDSPLTRADLASNGVILSYLKDTGIPVLSEEGRQIPFEERKSWKQLWIVDPLDGTKEFIKKNGEFTVNIALVENGNVKMGVVYTPALKELFVGADQIGSFKVDNVTLFEPSLLERGQKLPIPSERKTYTIVASRSHMSPETEVFTREKEKEHGQIKLISKGSSLKLCMVAEGLADCYPRFAPTMEWDTAAGHGVCQFAGIDVIDLETKSTMVYNRFSLLNNWFLVQSK